jgi:hypothetical protein
LSLTPQFLDELRARTVLSTLIGKSIKVTRAGREFKACCPFHNEKTPSFTINDDKGFYHCLSTRRNWYWRVGASGCPVNSPTLASNCFGALN